MSDKNIKTEHKYRLTFSDENNSQKGWSIKLSWKRVICFLLIILAIVITVTILLLRNTPLQMLLPNYELRREYITNTLRVDSLISEITIRNRYIDNFRNIAKDSIVPEFIYKQNDSAAIRTNSLIEISEREKAFVKKIDESEKFNLKVLSPLAAEGILFLAPIKAGIIDKTAENYNFGNGINITTAKNAAVTAVYNGSIIDVSFNMDSGNSVTVQHPHGFISKYLGLSTVHVTKGDKIIAGETVGSINENKRIGKCQFRFELWHDGLALNPERYITF